MPPRQIRVYSEDNHFQHADVLKRNRTKRHKHGECFVEGVKALNEVVRGGWPVRALLYPRDTRLSGWARQMLADPRVGSHIELPPALMAKLSDKENPSELLAIVATPSDDLARIPLRPGMLVLLLDRPSNPGNLGTTIRSAAAFGADGLLITGHAADLYDPQTIRSSTGMIFSQPIVRVGSLAEVRAWFEAARAAVPGLQIVVTSHAGATLIEDCDFRRPTALVLGNETHGASVSLRDLGDQLVKIPLEGPTTSLNVSCAASIFLHEIRRQRRAAAR